jgi:hypothetical protein
MPAPREITDALESVVSIYFSDVRHKLRAAFILTDELVEMICKTKAKQAQPNLGHIYFVPLLRHAAVDLNPVVDPQNPVVVQLGTTLHANHQTRNQLQHVNPALSVDDQHCADAILDAVDTIECFPGSRAAFQFALRIALRVISLHSSQGDLRQRNEFEDAMRTHRWNGAERRASVKEPPVPVGTRRYWGLVVMPACADIETILNRLGVP